MGPNERRAQEENSSSYYGWNKDGSFSHGLTREEKESRLREARA